MKTEKKPCALSESPETRPGVAAIDELRKLVRNFDNMREDFNTRFSVRELFALHMAHMLSGWDACPDNWTTRQVYEAIDDGLVPQWDSNGLPVYPGKPVAECVK